MGSEVLDKLKDKVDKTITKLADPNFRKDPIGGKYGFVTSVISSAYKRHGSILEEAIIERLKEASHLDVITEDEFCVSDKANTLALKSGKDFTDMPGVNLQYEKKNPERTLQVDAIVYNKKNKIVSSYEIKRGNGNFDAGKKRSIRLDILSTNFLLRDYYNKNRQVRPKAAHSYIICYYGLRALPKPFSLIAEDLDKHFGFKVHEEVEKVNKYFKNLLHKMIESKT